MSFRQIFLPFQAEKILRRFTATGDAVPPGGIPRV